MNRFLGSVSLSVASKLAGLLVVAFAAIVSAETITVELRPKVLERATDNPVRLLFNGKNFQGVELRVGPASRIQADPDVALVSRYIQASALGDRDAIVAEWHPAERQLIKVRMQNQGLLDKNTRQFSTSQHFWLMARLDYGTFNIYLVAQKLQDRQIVPFVFPVRNDAQGRGASDELSSDPVFAVLAREVVTNFIEQFVQKNPDAAR